MRGLITFLGKILEGVAAKVIVGLVLAAVSGGGLRCAVKEEVEAKPPPERLTPDVVQRVLQVPERWERARRHEPMVALEKRPPVRFRMEYPPKERAEEWVKK